MLDYATSTLPNGKKLHALSAGCYLNHKEHFARDTWHMWWSGIMVKEGGWVMDLMQSGNN